MTERIQYGEYGPEHAIRVGYDWDEYEEGKTNQDLFGEILDCENFDQVRHITIANWQGAFECEGCQPVADWLVENAAKLSHVESLRIADMESEECEISWINQADYGALWKAMPGLRHLTLQGGEELVLGDIVSDSLRSLEIICGGLPASCIAQISRAKAPNLVKLNLYLGVEDYGFDAGPQEIRALLENSDFPALTYLGLCNSEIATQVVEQVLDSRYASRVQTLDLSKSVFTDDSARVLLAGASALTNLKLLDLSYHYVSETVQARLKALPFEVDLSDPQTYDEKHEYYNCPMFTE